MVAMQKHAIRYLMCQMKLYIAENLILNKELPQNKDLSHDKYKDKIFRQLDCTLIEYMHQEILDQITEEKKTTGYSELKLFDSARGVFTEGGPAYSGAGILIKEQKSRFKK